MKDVGIQLYSGANSTLKLQFYFSPLCTFSPDIWSKAVTIVTLSLQLHCHNRHILEAPKMSFFKCFE